MPAKLTQKQFEEKANEVHGIGTYDYSQSTYLGSDIKILIICKNNHKFKQTPHAHLLKQGCPHCSQRAKMTKETFETLASKLHGNKYDYSLVEYIDNKTEVMIICPVHGVFKQRPDSHTRRKNPCGCNKCRKTIKHDDELFITKSIEYHGNKYDYSLVDYINNRIKVSIICSEHGIFRQRPNRHLQGDGCPKCAKKRTVKTSKGQKELYDLLKPLLNFETNIQLEYNISFGDKNFAQTDICLPEKNIVIEYHGDYWHCNPKKYNADYYHKNYKITAKEIWEKDKKRKQKLENLGYKVFVVWENDFKNDKENIVNELLKQIEQCQKN